MVKCNNARKAQALSYRVNMTTVNSQIGIPIETSQTEWCGISRHSANDLVGRLDPDAQGKLEQATDFLLEILADGPVATKDIETKARERDISVTGALRRAADAKAR